MREGAIEPTSVSVLARSHQLLGAKKLSSARVDESLMTPLPWSQAALLQGVNEVVPPLPVAT